MLEQYLSDYKITLELAANSKYFIFCRLRSSQRQRRFRCDEVCGGAVWRVKWYVPVRFSGVYTCSVWSCHYVYSLFACVCVSGSSWNQVYSGLAVECVCDGLSPGCSYQARVHCISAGGESPVCHTKICNPL